MQPPKIIAWDKRHQRMYRRTIWIDSGGKVYVDTDPNGIDMSGKYRIIRSDHLEIMEYSGLKDKQGQGIYEHQIMIILLPESSFWGDQGGDTRIGQVVYEPDYAGYIVQWSHSKNQHHVRLTCDVGFQGEVLGNKYKNPELLKEIS